MAAMEDSMPSKRPDSRENSSISASQGGHKQVSGSYTNDYSIPKSNIGYQTKKDEDDDAENAIPTLSKKARRALRQLELEKEQALAKDFYREFYPDNV